MTVPLSFFRSETSQKLRAESRAEDLLLVLQTRGIEITDSVHTRITECTDPDLLREWFTRALTAHSAAQVFGGAEPTV